ncbi:MAG TPA: DUF3151 domain-containing protein [Egibacteraceae bacterium]|nr:DUF3151 domain-containing protein [Egibacteraceae bacterium]
MSLRIAGEDAPEPTLLPEEPQEARHALAQALGGDVPDIAVREVAASYPTFLEAWAILAERALHAGDPVAAYAFARTGYHRGLDKVRRAGWRGSGPVPWSHEANRGFLRSVHALGRAAWAIGEHEEADRCAVFLRELDPEAARVLED